MFSTIRAETEQEYLIAAGLFREYADSLDFTLSFQNFENELTVLPKMYGPPDGAVFLVRSEEDYIGVAGLRRIAGDHTCEIKRMYIRPGFQGKGIGKILMAAIIDTARELGYRTVKLDTLGDKMPAAVKLYESFGFQQTTPYNFNPHDTVLYFEKTL